MATVIEVIEGAHRTYMQSEDRAELIKAAENLTTLLSNKSYDKLISDTNRENAHYLLIKIKLKIYAVAYFCEGYDGGDFAELKGYAEEAVGLSVTLGFTKTAEICKRVLACAEKINAVMADAEEWQSRLIDGDGRCVAK